MITEMTPNFSLEEMLITQHRDIPEQYMPSDYVKNNLKDLCENILQSLRDKLGKTVIVSSGYRCPKLNTLIGGACNSQHIVGKAADINVAGMTVQEVYDFIKRSGLPYDQLIQEFGQWVHVSYNGQKNRSESMYAVKVQGKTEYQADTVV
jgi:zinc D-Ala-D-Ala carboxypeptidase